MKNIINNLSLKIYNWLNLDKSCDNDKELYIHSIELSLYENTSLLISIIIGILFNRFIEILIFLFIFTTIRKFSGGYHADTYFKCFIIFQIIIIIVILLNKYIYFNNFFNFTISLLSYFYIIINSPMQHINNPLNKHEIKYNKIKAVVYSTLALICLIYFMIFNINYKSIIMLSMFTIAFLMVIFKYNKIV